MTIRRNAVRCVTCDEVIESKHRHDFKWCKGGHIAVDGGHAYIRRAWDDKKQFEIEDLTEEDEEDE